MFTSQCTRKYIFTGYTPDQVELYTAMSFVLMCSLHGNVRSQSIVYESFGQIRRPEASDYFRGNRQLSWRSTVTARATPNLAREDRETDDDGGERREEQQREKCVLGNIG